MAPLLIIYLQACLRIVFLCLRLVWVACWLWTLYNQVAVGKRQNCAFKRGRAPAIKGVGNLNVVLSDCSTRHLGLSAFAKFYMEFKKTLLHITHILNGER